MAQLLNLAIFSENYFYRLQKEYLFPVIHTNYTYPVFDVARCCVRVSEGSAFTFVW